MPIKQGLSTIIHSGMNGSQPLFSPLFFILAQTFRPIQQISCRYGHIRSVTDLQEEKQWYLHVWLQRGISIH
jgi:hypothetical protein